MAKWRFAVSSDAEPIEVPPSAAPDCALAAKPADTMRRPYRSAGSWGGSKMDNTKGWRVTFLGI
jgi:hypothetical protein